MRKMRMVKLCAPPKGCGKKIKARSLFSNGLLTLAKKAGRSGITRGMCAQTLRSQRGGTNCHVCCCRQWEAPSLPLCFKNETKQNSFSTMHTRECLASATEQHSYHVSLSIKWHVCPLPRKILVPNTNRAAWLPSSVYSSRTAIHPRSHLKDITKTMMKSLTHCAGKSWDALQSRCTSFPRRKECLPLATAPIWRKSRHCEGSVGSHGQGLLWGEGCQGTSCWRNDK